MQKKILKRTSEKSNLCIVFSSEEQGIYEINEGDIVDIEIVTVKKMKGGKGKNDRMEEDRV